VGPCRDPLKPHKMSPPDLQGPKAGVEERIPLQESCPYRLQGAAAEDAKNIRSGCFSFRGSRAQFNICLYYIL
jgi:hypothetical protein